MYTDHDIWQALGMKSISLHVGILCTISYFASIGILNEYVFGLFFKGVEEI